MLTTSNAVCFSLALCVFAAASFCARPARGADRDLPWATAQAAELTKQAERALSAGQTEQATGRLLEALRFDATHGPAYLLLGSIYERTGLSIEAERAYAMAIERVPAFVPAYRAHASLELRLGRPRDAVATLRAAGKLAPGDAALVRELMHAEIRSNLLPAALSSARRLQTLTAPTDPRAHTEAHATARALAALLGEIDPVVAGASLDADPLRRALARAALR